jgi:hypothetical protein
MALEIRPLKYEDYDDFLLKWWSDWKWDAPTRDFLPSDGTGGIVVYDGDTPICAGFMYITNSKVSWVDWIISNREYRVKPNRTQAISLLIDALTNICKNSGAKYVYALIKHKNLIDTYNKLGYVCGDTYVGEMIKTL